MRVALLVVMMSASAVARPQQPPGLTPDEIAQAIRARQPKFRACFERALKRDAGLTGKFEYVFTIDGRGKVSRAVSAAPTKASSGVDACITAEMKRIVFRATGETVTIRYPINSDR